LQIKTIRRKNTIIFVDKNVTRRYVIDIVIVCARYRL